MILKLSLPLLCMGGHLVSAVTLHIEYYILYSMIRTVSYGPRYYNINEPPK